jgi:hypothetical protein
MLSPAPNDARLVAPGQTGCEASSRYATRDRKQAGSGRRGRLSSSPNVITGKLETTQVYDRRLNRSRAVERVRDLSSGGSRFDAFPVEAPSGVEPL